MGKPATLGLAIAAGILAMLLMPSSPEAQPGSIETVEGTFGICGHSPSPTCVVDGDTFRVEGRRVRVIGIDTAEKRARCQYEAELAEQSTRALRDWLNRGPFVMTPHGLDRYGRELQTITRSGTNGVDESLANWMIASGGARSYDGGHRSGWC